MKHKFPTFYSGHNNKGNAFYISKPQFPFLNLGISSFPHQQSPGPIPKPSRLSCVFHHSP